VPGLSKCGTDPFARGKPSWSEDWVKEQQALVDLGYFERREVVLTNRDVPKDPSDAELEPEVRKAFWGGLNSPWFIYMDSNRPKWLRVSGTNLDEFERIVSRWDARVTR
jgi:hypothetical protein